MPDSLPVPRRLWPRALTAAAQRYTPQEYRASAFHHGPWQREAWYYYDQLGEFRQAVDWQARGMSRILLRAAEILPDGPVILPDGPAAALMAQFAGGTPGQAQFLAAVTPHLLVPGEGWLVAERASPLVPLAFADWQMYATDAIQAIGNTWQVQDDGNRWRALAPDNLPIRIYQPHPRRPWLATSAAEAAIPIMRRIELIDKRIIAMMVSRLAMNGLLLIPAEGTIQVPEQYREAPDPFVEFLIDIASKNIAEPGLASAGIPIPITFTENLIEKWRILKADDPLDEWLLKERSDEIGRLGDALNISRERVTGGTGEVNHWGSWQLAEEEVRLTFAPLAEVVCQAVTKSFLHPALLLLGEPLVGPSGGPTVAWYDPVKLAARPDLSASAQKLYADGAINEVAYRRESGFDEADAQNPEQRTEWVWLQALRIPELAPVAVKHLTGLDVTPLTPVGGGARPLAAGPVDAAPAPPPTGPPATFGVPPPAPGSEPVTASVLLREPVEVNGNGRR